MANSYPPTRSHLAARQTVRAVGSDRRLARQYVDVPWRLYDGDANWVPPLRSAALKALDRRRNPFHRHADVEHFVAFDGSTPVGRIAATVYPPYNERYGTRTGFFGFFESPQDPGQAGALLHAAERWLADLGMERVAGPYNYCSTQEMGLLIGGFDEPPVAFQTYNPPFYRELLEQHGYSLGFSMSAFKWCVEEHAHLAPPIWEAGDAALAQAGLVARRLNRRRFKQEMRLLRNLFNTAFASNEDVLPYEEDVFEDMIMPLRPFADERLITFIERDGEPVAFTVMAPNVNEILKPLNGRVRPRDLLRLRRLKRDVRAAVLLIVGRVPSARGMGLGVSLVAELTRGFLEAGYETLHTTWIHDDNAASQALAGQFGAAPTKRFAIFEREL